MNKPAVEEKPSISYETLWKTIIRPPKDEYDDTMLGDLVFNFNCKTYIRKDYKLLSSRGYLMKCSFLEPEDESRPTEEMPVVIYLHGNSSSRLEGWKMRFLLMKHDINLFVFDFPGSGQSEGEYISLGYHEQKDVKVIVDFVEKLPGVGRIGLWGRSMGAATAMLYSHKDERICAVVMDSPFADFKRLAKELCKSQINLPDFLLDAALGILNITVKKKNEMDVNEIKPIEYADISKTPAVFVHARTDELISVQHSRDIYEKYGGEKKLIECEGGHNSARNNKTLEQVGKFLLKYLKPYN